MLAVALLLGASSVSARTDLAPRRKLLSLRGGAGATLQKTLPKAFEKALTEDNLIVVRAAVESGTVDPRTCPSATGNAMVHIAASHDSLRCLLFLLDGGHSPVDLRRFDGVTASMFAAQNGMREALQSLLQRGADVNAADNDGSSAIHFAARQGHAECLGVLLQSRGAKLDAKRTDGITALMCAAASSRLECLQLLLSCGADATVTNEVGATALHFASRQGNRDCIEALLRSRVAQKIVGMQDKVGTAPLHLAVDGGHGAGASALMRAGAAVDPKRKDGSTPLHYASIKGNLECARLLLAAGADASARRTDGATPAHMAAQMGHADVLEQLMNGGADLNARLPSGSTPLDLASAAAQAGGVRRKAKPPIGHLNCIVLLEQAGAVSSASR